MKNYPNCKYCGSSHVVRKGKVKGAYKFKCLNCLKWYRISFTHKEPSKLNILTSYLDGNPLRKLADQAKVSPMTIFRMCERDLKALPSNISVTRTLCIRFCGYLVFDGKYFPVKRYDYGIVLLWGVDFLTHDVPHFELSSSENHTACVQYFMVLKNMNYPLQYLVCDDNGAAKRAARYVYPNVIIQTCLNHYKENIRTDLNTRSNGTYVKFYLEVEALFTKRLEFVNFTREVAVLYANYKEDKNCLRWLEDQNLLLITNFKMYLTQLI